MKKVSKIYSRFRENRGKRFFFGQFPSQRGKSCRKEKLCRIWEQEYSSPWLDNVNFQKKFSNVLRFCALLMRSLTLGGVMGTKNRIVCVVFQSECYVK